MYSPSATNWANRLHWWSYWERGLLYFLTTTHVFITYVLYWQLWEFTPLAVLCSLRTLCEVLLAVLCIAFLYMRIRNTVLNCIDCLSAMLTFSALYFSGRIKCVNFESLTLRKVVKCWWADRQTVRDLVREPVVVLLLRTECCILDHWYNSLPLFVILYQSVCFFFTARCYAEHVDATVKSSVCPRVCWSICNVQVLWSRRLEYFENTPKFTRQTILLKWWSLISLRIFV